MQQAGREPGWVKQLGVQNEKGDKAADQAGIGARPGDAAPQCADHQRAGKGCHQTAVADPHNQGDVGLDQGPGQGRTQQQDDPG